MFRIPPALWIVVVCLTPIAWGADKKITYKEGYVYQVTGTINRVDAHSLRITRDGGGEQIVFLTENTVAVARDKVVEHPDYQEGQHVHVWAGLVGRIAKIEFLDPPADSKPDK